MLAELPTAEACGIVMDFDDSVTTEQALYRVARAITAVVGSRAGDAMRRIKFEAVKDPELAKLVDERFQAPRRAALLELLRRGVERGEVRPGADTELVADVIPAVLTHRLVMLGERLGERQIRQIMEQVFLPLIEVR
jgi:hypothetical protein